jgi:hypothetical protein
VTVINPDFKPASFSPIQGSSFKWPLGLPVDSSNDVWTANYFSSTVTEIRSDGAVAGVYQLPTGTLPGSVAVDGSGRIWVFGFGRPQVWLLCGVNLAACPPGPRVGQLLSPPLGFQSAAIQHVASGQIDQSGNIWISNWSQLLPPAGGVGIVELIGIRHPGVHPPHPASGRSVRRRVGHMYPGDCGELSATY